MPLCCVCVSSILLKKERCDGFQNPGNKCHSDESKEYAHDSLFCLSLDLLCGDTWDRHTDAHDDHEKDTDDETDKEDVFVDIGDDGDKSIWTTDGTLIARSLTTAGRSCCSSARDIAGFAGPCRDTGVITENSRIEFVLCGESKTRRSEDREKHEGDIFFHTVF